MRKPEIPEILQGKLEFGNPEQIKALRGYEENLEVFEQHREGEVATTWSLQSIRNHLISLFAM